jgi:hypothetical protein
LAAWASWSIITSVEYAVWVEPTERHHRTDTPTSVVTRSTLRSGIAYGRFEAPSTEVGSTPSLIQAANDDPAMIDWPTMRCRQPIGFPSRLTPAVILWT